MDKATHEKQKSISRQFIEIADDIEKRLGLKTRLHKLEIENLGQPECDVGVYTSTDMLIGVVEVRLSVKDCKARVISALFRDLEDAVDDWTFDVTGKTPRKLLCPNPNCLTRLWEPDSSLPYQTICPQCRTAGVSMLSTKEAEELIRKSRRMRCVTKSCKTEEWEGCGHEVELCPSCRQPGTLIEPGIVARNETARKLLCPNSNCSIDFWMLDASAKYQTVCPRCTTAGVTEGHGESQPKIICVSPTCEYTEWETGVLQSERCPMCHMLGVCVSTLSSKELADIKEGKHK